MTAPVRLRLLGRSLQRRRPSRALRSLAGLCAIAMVASAGYVVQPGDTLEGIARRLGTSVDALAQLNELANPNRIIAGATLLLPGEQGDAPAPAADTAQGQAAGTHVVAPGEVLSRIAAQYGMSVQALVDANGLSDANYIRVGQRLTIPGSAAGPADSAGDAPAPAPAAASRDDAERMIEQIAAEYGWNPAWIKALAWQESGFQMSVRSSTGAVGVMQVMPGTGKFVSRLVGRPLDLHDLRDNVVAGVAFLDYLYGLTGADIDRTLAGYYQGLASVRRNGMYDDTRRYIANIKALKVRFEG